MGPRAGKSLARDGLDRDNAGLPRDRCGRAMKDLESFRRQIDTIDDRLLALLGERFAVVREVAAYKAPRGIPVVIPERVTQVRERCAAKRRATGSTPMSSGASTTC
jgi:Chorismate mutase